jgi:hypothetical protein
MTKFSNEIQNLFIEASEKLPLKMIEGECWDLISESLLKYTHSKKDLGNVEPVKKKMNHSDIIMTIIKELKKFESLSSHHHVGYSLAEKVVSYCINFEADMIIIDLVILIFPNILESTVGRIINLKRMICDGKPIDDLIRSFSPEMTIQDGISISKMAKTYVLCDV